MHATVILVFAVTLFVAVNCQENGAIRLFNNGQASSNLTAGIVEVYNDGSWSTVCRLDSYGIQTWGYNEATVACQQLGYTGASNYGYAGDGTNDFGEDPNPQQLYDVDCSLSSYLVLLQCFYLSGSTGSCAKSDDVTVTCYTSRLTDLPFTGMIRLQNGTYVTSGRVEVYCNSQWGTLCDSGFSNSVGQTVCYQLGYNSLVNYQSGLQPAASSVPIWLSSYYCSGGYSCISHCQTCPSQSSSTCIHSQDVSVSCAYDSTLYNYGSLLNTCNNYLSTGVIVAIVFAVIFMFAICICLWIGIPVCICCCLGVGIGAAAHSHHHYDHI